jgi:4-amino-4-deoxy-L-arabinose transferase-like glycosyltransferase
MNISENRDKDRGLTTENDNVAQPDAPAPRPGRPVLDISLLLAAIVAVQLWVVTAGWWVYFPSYGQRYRLLADAFLHGQLSLLDKPAPQLLALPDPYDPAANVPYRTHDAVLYNGNYYFYWGAVPALLIAAVQVVTRLDDSNWGDQYLAAILVLGTLTLLVLLILRIRRRLFPRQPLRSAWPAILSFGVGPPILFALARAAVYETAIMAGQFFLLAGLCAAWRKLSRPGAGTIWLLAAGILWAMSAGSRLSLAPAVAALAVITLLHVWRQRTPVRCAAALFVPLLAAAVMIGWYNYARFGSATEFGLRYQLSGHNQNAAPSGKIASAAYVLPNLLRYFFQPGQWQSSFPYLLPAKDRPGVDAWFALPADFNFEPMLGLIWSQPFLLLAPFALLRSPKASQADRSLNSWLKWSLFAAAILGFAPALVLEGSTMRYLLDAVPCLTILAAIGLWRILARLELRPTLATAATFAFLFLAIVQGVFGLQLAITGYGDHFSMENPALFASLCRFFPSMN